MSPQRTEAIIADIKRILVAVKALPMAPSELASDANIISDLRLDSIELLNFMLEIEAQLDIQIDLGRIEYAMLFSISTLAEFLATMPSAVRPSAP